MVTGWKSSYGTTQVCAQSVFVSQNNKWHRDMALREPLFISFIQYTVYEGMCVCGTELPAEDREKWETFISGQLADTNKRNTVDLVSNHMNINNDVEFFRVHVGCTIQLLNEAFFICVGSEVPHFGY